MERDKKIERLNQEFKIKMTAEHDIKEYELEIEILKEKILRKKLVINEEEEIIERLCNELKLEKYEEEE